MAPYHHSLVRALAWAISSPNIIDTTAQLPFPSDDEMAARFHERRTWFDALDKNPSPLVEYVQTHGNWRVGIQFETLISFYLTHHPGYTLLARNLQVYAEKQTLGAFDYIVRNSRGLVEHWEVAVKFYLRSTTARHWAAWLGPNRRDRLDIKVTRMRDHQLPLSDTDAGRRALANIGVCSPPIHVAWLKGALFTPFRHEVLVPPNSGTGQPSGIWLQRQEQDEFVRRHPGAMWFRRDKPDWLGSSRQLRAHCLDHQSWLKQAHSQPDFAPEMWSLMKPDGPMYQEEMRVFLVADDWSPDIS